MTDELPTQLEEEDRSAVGRAGEFSRARVVGELV